GLVLCLCAIWVALSLFGYRYLAERRLREELYSAASSGDMASWKRLTVDQSSDALDKLIMLAQNRNASVQVRVATVNHLQTVTQSYESYLAFLLWIEEPFVVRHSAREYFEHRGCGEDCVSAASYAIRDLWQGKPILEKMKEPKPSDTDLQEIVTRNTQEI